MSPMSFTTFLGGAPAYRPGAAQKFYVSVPIAILIFLVAQFGAVMAYRAMGFDPAALGPPANVTPSLDTGAAPPAITPGQLLVVLLSQIGIVALTMLSAKAGPGGIIAALKLQPPEGGVRAYLWALAVMVPVLALLNSFVYALKPEDYINDFRQFVGAVKGPWPIVAALAIGFGAPLSEELLFRGYLLASATATRIPFWPAAILINAAWTSLHIQYSLAGIIEVFVIGLFLCWVTWRTGSTRVALFCHAVYNSTLFLIMRLLPIG